MDVRLVVVGIFTILVLVVLLIRGKLLPAMVFTVVPVVGGLLAGYSLSEIGTLAKAGWTTVSTSIMVTAFAILFFSVMSDVGMFHIITKPIIHKAKGSKNPAIAICVAASVVAAIGHLDGAGNTTIMITLPLMMPLFDTMKMDRKALALSMGIVVGAMNLVPWTGPTRYTAMAMGMEPVEFWRYIIPAQVIMLICGFISAWLLGKREIKRGCINSLEGIEQAEETEELTPCEKDKKIFFVNIGLTLITILVLIAGLLNSGLTFMIASFIALVYNYGDKKKQSKKIREFAPNILTMTMNVMAVGVLLGILSEGGMVNAIAETLVGAMPEAVGPYAFLIVAILAAPLLMCLGTGPYYQALVPIIIAVSAKYGVNPLLAGGVALLPSGVSVCISPMVAANHISCGLLQFDIGAFIKYAWKWVLLISWISIAVAYITISIIV